jgi:hypothetical protein
VDLERILDATDPAVQEDILTLARLFQDISALGDAERRACIGILETFRAYARRTE